MDEARSEYSRVNLSSDPIYRYLRITKGGPGGVAGRAAEQDLVDAAWMQRLRRIHQLQSAWWVFATAEHSRFQHALGAMHLAGEWTRHLYPSLRVSCGDVPSAQLVEETMRSASFTTRSSPSAASRCTPTPRKRFTCSSTRVSTSITRSTSTAPCAGSTCSCARCFGRRSSSCSGATP